MLPGLYEWIPLSDSSGDKGLLNRFMISIAPFAGCERRACPLLKLLIITGTTMHVAGESWRWGRRGKKDAFLCDFSKTGGGSGPHRFAPFPVGMLRIEIPSGLS
jgi:hypothetical protein